MKRLGTIIACMSLIVLLMISSYAADKNTYYIEECSLSVDIPNLFVVFTRDTDASDPNLDRLGLSWNELSSVFNERSMYLDAIDENGEVICQKDTVLTAEDADKIQNAGIVSIKVLSNIL